MRMRSMPPPPVSGKTPRAPRCTKARDRPKVPARGLALLFMPGNSGGIVGLGGAYRVGAAGAGFRLDLAPLEIFPQRRPQAPLLPHLLRALSPLVHGCKITARGRATEALRCEWSLEGACLRHVGPYGKDRSARAPMHWSIFASRRRCRSSVVEHPLGKGEVVSSILTGSTRHAPICALSCSRLPSPHKRSNARTWGK